MNLVPFGKIYSKRYTQLSCDVRDFHIFILSVLLGLFGDFSTT